jgi:hypothetical protein
VLRLLKLGGVVEDTTVLEESNDAFSDGRLWFWGLP